MKSNTNERVLGANRAQFREVRRVRVCRIPARVGARDYRIPSTWSLRQVEASQNSRYDHPSGCVRDAHLLSHQISQQARRIRPLRIPPDAARRGLQLQRLQVDQYLWSPNQLTEFPLVFFEILRSVHIQRKHSRQSCKLLGALVSGDEGFSVDITTQFLVDPAIAEATRSTQDLSQLSPISSKRQVIRHDKLNWMLSNMHDEHQAPEDHRCLASR